MMDETKRAMNMENYMQENEKPSSLSGQRAEMTFVELIALFVRKRKLFATVFVIMALLLVGGSLFRTLLIRNSKGDDFVVTAKAIVIDPYFDRAGEFCSGLAATENAAKIIGKELGIDESKIDRKDFTINYDSSIKMLSIAVKGKTEDGARQLALANMAATRELMRRYGSERYEGIATRMEAEAANLLNAPKMEYFKNAATPYFEGYAQAIANRIEIMALIDATQTSISDPSIPVGLLARDLDAAKTTEANARARFENFVKEAKIPPQKARVEVETRGSEILRSKIALLREILPAVLVVFDIVDVKVDKIASAGIGIGPLIGIVAALFLAVTAILIAGYVERIKADPEALRLLRESRMHK